MTPATQITLRPVEPADTEQLSRILFEAFGDIHDHHRFLFRWCLEQGLRAVKPMNVMARGAYQEPRGAWFPSVIY